MWWKCSWIKCSEFFICLQRMKARGLKACPWQHSNFALPGDPACSSKASSPSHCPQKRWRYLHFELFLNFPMQRLALQINWAGMLVLALGSLWSAEMRRDRHTCISSASSACFILVLWGSITFSTSKAKVVRLLTETTMSISKRNAMLASFPWK